MVIGMQVNTKTRHRIKLPAGSVTRRVISTNCHREEVLTCHEKMRGCSAGSEKLGGDIYKLYSIRRTHTDRKMRKMSFQTHLRLNLKCTNKYYAKKGSQRSLRVFKCVLR